MDKIQEFWYCVSNQDQLPIYKLDEINCSQSCSMLINFIKDYKMQINSQPITSKEQIISNILLSNPSYLNEIRKLVGISDKRLYLELSFIFNRYKNSSNQNILIEKRTDLKKHSTTFFISVKLFT